MAAFHAVVLAGGSGTRFWPMSRRKRPKQFLPLLGPASMVRQTVERLAPLFPPERCWVICGRDHLAGMVEELVALPPENLCDEPVGRDTAPAIGLAAALLEWRDPGAVMAVLPSDQHVASVPRYHEALRRAEALARDGALVVLGVRPTRPATGFGYVECDGDRVVRFREKPDLETATRFAADPRFRWNAGMFVWSAARILEEIGRHLPELRRGLDEIAASFGSSRMPEVLNRVYPTLPRISVDYGVMEKTAGIRMVEADFGWDDVGSWASAASIRKRDAAGNVAAALASLPDSTGCAVFSTDPEHLVAAVGVRDLVIVHTPDATLVVPLDRAEDVKRIVEELRARGLDRYL